MKIFMVHSRTVKRFSPFLIALTVIVLIPVLRTHAAPVLGGQDCTMITGRQSEPVDSKTEVRFKKYMYNSASPKTFASMMDLERWCFLWDEERIKDAGRRQERMDFRSRTLQDRFYHIDVGATKKEDQEPRVAIPETDKELKDLSMNRQIRIRARLINRNCDPGGRTGWEMEEYAICLKELKKITDASSEIVEKSRLAGSSLRTEQRRRNAITPRENTERAGYGEGSSVEDVQSSSEEEGKLNKAVFDPEGPGSAPLSNTLENRIRSHVNRRDCHRVTPPEAKVRCLWLVQYQLVSRQPGADRAVSRLRSRGVLEGAVIRRGIDSVYRESIGSIGAIDKQRRLLGFRPSPRTIQEIKENYQEAIVVPGDCAVDPKLCNK